MIRHCRHDWELRTEIVRRILRRPLRREWRICRNCLRVEAVPGKKMNSERKK